MAYCVLTKSLNFHNLAVFYRRVVALSVEVTPFFYLEPFSSYWPFNGMRLYFLNSEYRRGLTIIDAFFSTCFNVLDVICNLTMSIQNIFRLFIYLFMYKKGK